LCIVLRGWDTLQCNNLTLCLCSERETQIANGREQCGKPSWDVEARKPE